MANLAASGERWKPGSLSGHSSELTTILPFGVSFNGSTVVRIVEYPIVSLPTLSPYHLGSSLMMKDTVSPGCNSKLCCLPLTVDFVLP